MAEHLLPQNYSIASGKMPESSNPSQSVYTGSFIQPEDVTADAVVTDVPAVEVEVQAPVVQEVQGIQTFATEVSQDHEIEDGYRDMNSKPTDPQGSSAEQSTEDSDMQIVIPTVFMISTKDLSKSEKEDPNPTITDTLSVSKDSSRNEVNTHMNIPTQVLPIQTVIPNSDPDDVTSDAITQPTVSTSVTAPTDADIEHVVSMASEINTTPRVLPNNKKSLGEHLQQRELRGKNDVTRRSKNTEKKREKNLLWCEDCGKANIGYCKKHGALTIVTDTHVPTYARLTLPSVLCIKKDAKGEGVYAKRYIKSRSQFGPVQAPMCSEPSKKDEKQPYFFLKGYDEDDNFRQYLLNDEDKCNWMMFVRPAQTYADQNLVAYIYDGQVYYVTTKPVEYGKELRVWYSTDYAVKIGMSLFIDVKQDRVKDTPTQPEQEERDAPNTSTDPASDECEDVDMDSDEEFQIVENDDFSDDGTVCVSCDTDFKSKELLSSHSCKSKKTAGKRGHGATKRKGSPRKLTLDDDWEPQDEKKEVKAKRNKRRLGRKSHDRTKSAKTKKAKKMVLETPRKKYQRTPKFSCAYCPKVFSCQDPFRAHEASHTGKSAYMCDFEGCGKGFDTKFTHWRHMLCHQKSKDKQCPYCDKSFNRMDHLKTHLKTHDQQRFSYLCDKCGKSYLHKSTYDYHIALHAAKEGDSLACMICSEQFPNKEELIKHAQTHNRYRSMTDAPKRHACPVCNRMFGTSKDVRRHMIVHTKEKHFLCELCPQTFGRKDHLRRHYKTNHSKEPRKEKVDDSELPYCCELCQQRFAKKKQLANHKKFGHEQTFEPQMPRVDQHPLQQAAGDITEASVTSSSYNLYTLSTPANPVSVVHNQAAKALERYINTNVTSSSPVLNTTPTVMDTAPPVTYINGQANMAVNLMPQVRDQLPEQMQQVKERIVFPSDQMASQRQPRQVPWTFVVEERDDHSYSTAPPVWTPKVPNFRPTVSTAAEVETARLLQSAQSSHSSFPVQCNNATTMAVAWDTMTEYFAVQPCSNITEVVTSNSIVHQQPQQQQQQPQQQQQTQNMSQSQRGHLQQSHSQQ